MSPAAHSAEIKSKNLCYNCLRKTHLLKDCRAITCRKCNKKHHTLLHFENSNPNPTSTSNTQNSSLHLNDESATSSHVACHTSSLIESQHGLLATVMVLVKNSLGKLVSCHALLDCGSQSNFISEDFYRQLNIKGKNANVNVTGISNVPYYIKFKVDLEIQSSKNNFQTAISCLGIKQITDPIPSSSIALSNLSIPNNIQLADPEFNIPKKVDLLIGVSAFWQMLCVGQISLGEGKPILQKTVFG